MKRGMLLPIIIITGLLVAQTLPLHRHVFDHQPTIPTDIHLTQTHVAFDDCCSENDSHSHHFDKFEQVLFLLIRTVQGMWFSFILLFLVFGSFMALIRNPRIRMHFSQSNFIYLPWRIPDALSLRAPPA